MAKFRGPIGFAKTVEKEPGVYVEEIVEKTYSCELLRNKRRLEASASVNDNINISNEISIIADPYANHHFHTMRYVEFSGAKWNVSSVDATQRPRLILTLGGVYNG
mgnify:CR=1 FL=1